MRCQAPWRLYFADALSQYVKIWFQSGINAPPPGGPPRMPACLSDPSSVSISDEMPAPWRLTTSGGLPVKMKFQSQTRCQPPGDDAQLGRRDSTVSEFQSQTRCQPPGDHHKAVVSAGNLSFNLRRDASPLATSVVKSDGQSAHLSFNLRRDASPLTTLLIRYAEQVELGFNLRRDASPLTTSSHVQQPPAFGFNLRRDASPLTTHEPTSMMASLLSFNLRRDASPLTTQEGLDRAISCFNLRRDASPLTTKIRRNNLGRLMFQSQTRCQPPDDACLTNQAPAGSFGFNLRRDASPLTTLRALARTLLSPFGFNLRRDASPLTTRCGAYPFYHLVVSISDEMPAP